tara:strand:- start:734 stop:889 length:156 start_codon:yes stop_codon:yes gene_type:complete
MSEPFDECPKCGGTNISFQEPEPDIGLDFHGNFCEDCDWQHEFDIYDYDDI